VRLGTERRSRWGRRGVLTLGGEGRGWPEFEEGRQRRKHRGGQRRSQVTAGFRCSAVDEKGWRDFVTATWRSWRPWLVPASNRGGIDEEKDFFLFSSNTFVKRII
jgi:hypothetical protein